MESKFCRVGYHSTRRGCRFNKSEEAEKFAKELYPKEFRILEGFGFGDFTKLTSDKISKYIVSVDQISQI